MKIISGLSEGQVLQRLGEKRGATAVLQIATKESGPVFVTILQGRKALAGWERRRIGRATKGQITAKLTGVPAGGPYRLVFVNEAGKPLGGVKQFFVGDVWVLGGQSNMQGLGDREGAAEPHPQVRAFSMAREWRLAEDALHVTGESPDECHHGGVPRSKEEIEFLRSQSPKGVGVGVFFGREMWERTGVPQGVIVTAQGGTSMQQWSPDRKRLGGASLYASMIASVRATGQPVAGVLWYQGESDATPEAAPLYTKRMKQLVATTRRDLQQPKLPWAVVQIGRVIKLDDDASGRRAWNAVQDAQRRLPEVIPNLEVVTAIDLGLNDPIHIAAHSFPLLAQRLARAAGLLTGKGPKEEPAPRLAKVGPVPRKARSESPYHLDLAFDHVVGGLQSHGEPRGFVILDAQGQVRPAIFRASLHGSTVRLHLLYHVGLGDSLCYGYGFDPVCNLHDARGHALPVFGPVPLTPPAALTPFLRCWEVSDVVETEATIDQLSHDEVRAIPMSWKVYPTDFVDEHMQWARRKGYAVFRTTIDLSEPMTLNLLMGYDGPFRIWVEGRDLFSNLNGTNPAVPDESTRSIQLEAGSREIVIAMGLGRGQPYGFFLRLQRTDLRPAVIKAGTGVLPQIQSA